jgi:hypothetical protein
VVTDSGGMSIGFPEASRWAEPMASRDALKGKTLRLAQRAYGLQPKGGPDEGGPTLGLPQKPRFPQQGYGRFI